MSYRNIDTHRNDLVIFDSPVAFREMAREWFADGLSASEAAILLLDYAWSYKIELDIRELRDILERCYDAKIEHIYGSLLTLNGELLD